MSPIRSSDDHLPAITMRESFSIEKVFSRCSRWQMIVRATNWTNLDSRSGFSYYSLLTYHLPLSTDPLTHSLTHSLTYLLTHLLNTYLLTYRSLLNLLTTHYLLTYNSLLNVRPKGEGPEAS